MLRFDLYGVYRDFSEFVRCNKIKLCIVVAVALIGCGLGVRSAFSAASADGVECIKRLNIYVLICGKRGFFGYFAVRCLSVLLLTVAMSMLSYRVYTACVNAGIVFLYCYMNFRSAAAAVILLKITFLPAAVLCVFPFAIVFAAYFCLVCVFSLNMSRDFRCYGSDNYFSCVGSVCKRLIFPFLFAALCALTESLLALILTLGVSA